jgi:hypothetical protein
MPKVTLQKWHHTLAQICKRGDGLLVAMNDLVSYEHDDDAEDGSIAGKSQNMQTKARHKALLPVIGVVTKLLEPPVAQSNSCQRHSWRKQREYLSTLS